MRESFEILDVKKNKNKKPTKQTWSWFVHITAKQ